MIIKKEVIKRRIAGDTILVPVGTAVYDSNGLFVLNELADYIWDLLPEVDSQEEICDRVMEAYDVSREEARKDIAEFLEKLRQMELI